MPTTKSPGMTQMLASVEQAVTDARDALLLAEKNHAAALTALSAADADRREAEEVLGRLQRFRDRLIGNAEH